MRWAAMSVALLSAVSGAPPVSAEPGQTDLDAARQREARAADELETSSAAVQAAAAALAEVAQQLPAAQTAAAQARGQLVGARAKASAAQATLQAAEQTRASAQAEVDAATVEVDASRQAVQRLARTAYQSGRLGGVQDVMDAKSPQQVLERAELLRSVFQAGTEGLDRLTRDRLALASRTADLKAEEKRAAEAREHADAEQARAEQLAADAETAVARVAALVAQRTKAKAITEQHREQDRQAYEAAQAASASLADQIRQAAARRAAAERAAAEAARAARDRVPDAASAPSSGRMQWPAAGRLTSRFGWRTHPIYGDRRFHAGIDVGAGTGTPIVAASGGVVLLSYYASGYGNLTVIDHGGGLTTSYAHQSAMLVGEGQPVARGQMIGRAGATGNVTGPHLHFEVRINGDPVDPLNYVRR